MTDVISSAIWAKRFKTRLLFFFFNPRHFDHRILFCLVIVYCFICLKFHDFPYGNEKQFYQRKISLQKFNVSLYMVLIIPANAK